MRRAAAGGGGSKVFAAVASKAGGSYSPGRPTPISTMGKPRHEYGAVGGRGVEACLGRLSGDVWHF